MDQEEMKSVETMKQLRGPKAVSELKRILDEEKQSSKIEIERELIERASSEFAELESNFADQSKTISELAEELHVAGGKNSELEKKNEKDEKEIKNLRAMVKDSLIRDEESKKEESDALKQNSKLQKKISEMDRRLKEADAIIAKQSEKISGLSNQNSQLQLQLKTREDDLKSSKEEVMHIQETILDLETKLEAKEDEIKKFNWRATVEDLQDLETTLQEHRRAVKTKLKSMKLKFIDATNQGAKELQETDLESTKEQIFLIRQAMDSRDEDVKKLQQTIDDLKTKLEAKDDEVKDLVRVAANVLDSQGLKLEECPGNIVKRISKALWQLKEWATIKNKEMLQEKAEIVAYREKVWKSVRELEAGIKHHEDGVSLFHQD